MSEFLMPVYTRLPISFVKGEGVWLLDDQGERYLDAISGVAVMVLGHAHPAIITAIIEQAHELMHVGNLYQIPEQIELARELCKLSGMSQVFFCNSGLEANETAIKVARLYAGQRNIKMPHILVMKNGYHGRSLATLSASMQNTLQAGFEPLVQGFIEVPFNNINALETLASHDKNIVAILVEPILGHGGLIIPNPGYLKKIRQLCDENHWLMMLDEVQTGIGHTGKMFAYEHEQIIPDVLSLAKALGHGIPSGACLVRGPALNLLQSGQHGSTMGGNPFATRVGLATLRTLVEDGWVEHAAMVGDYLLKKLQEVLRDQMGVKEVRGKGLMIGIELDRPAKGILSIGLKHRILFNIAGDHVIRLLPPLILNYEEADLIVERLSATLKEFVQ